MAKDRREREPRLSQFSHAGEDFVVLSVPLPDAPHPLLSEAENAIVRLVYEGRSNAQIAALRETSVRTIANQLQSIYQKLGVSSRSELCARIGAGESGS